MAAPEILYNKGENENPYDNAMTESFFSIAFISTTMSASRTNLEWNR